MKKLIAIILILFLLVPAAVSADSMAGIWAVWLPNSASFGSGNLSMIIVLNENNTYAVMNVIANEGDPNIQTSSGTWEAVTNGINLTPDGSGKANFFEYRDGMIWFANGSMNVGMVKLPDYSAAQMEYVNR